MGKLFGTDGIRGVANSELTPILAFKLGSALGKYLREEHARPTVMIGKDTRLSGDLLEGALIAGLCSMGADVISLGVIPTPGVAYLTLSEKDINMGIVISASHNPMQDNGIKVFSSDGYKLSDHVEDMLEDLMENHQDLYLESGENVGKIIKREGLAEKYLDFLRNTFNCMNKSENKNLDLYGLKIVVDCANGAASAYAAKLYESLGARVYAFNSEPDGVNINFECGSLFPHKMCKLVTEYDADLGCAFDGDADRVIMSDEQGNIVDGDKIMAIYAINRKKTKGLPNNIVVGTVMSNIGLEIVLNREGIKLHRAKVGDRYVSEDMRTYGAVVGGEKSGHVIYPEILPGGDGMLTALSMMCAVIESKKSLYELASEIKEYPQLLVNVKVQKKDGWDTDEVICEEIAKAEKELEGIGRLVIRPSGTEKLIRVMAEGPSQEKVNEIVHHLADVIAQRMKG